jgi:MocE subfamily Rieske [2Fe-2S] domain protein
LIDSCTSAISGLLRDELAEANAITFSASPVYDRQRPVPASHDYDPYPVASQVAVPRRDYSLTGVESRRAFARGLADAEWYRPPIDADRLHELMARSNGRAARDTLLWLAMLAGAGTWAWLALGTLWAIPAFIVYGALYGGAADSRWHEMGHGTAFRTSRLNDAVYYLASFMLLREPTVWRWSHARHHTDTIIVGRDPEIALPRPPSRVAVVTSFLGLRQLPPMLRRLVGHAAGRVGDETKDFVPADEWRRVIWEARAFVTILAAVTVWSLATGSIVPLLFIGLPSWYGIWLLVFFGFTQHAVLQEDVLDHRLNTRTVYMNPVFRFLYSNMNYHVEHHLFPTVPYHALPSLHGEVKDHLAPATPSTLAAYREILGTVPIQAVDPSYEVPGRGVPIDPGASWRHPDVGEYLWADVNGDGRTDMGSAADIEVGDVRRVDVGDRTFAVYRLADDEYAVTDGLCTHGQAHLATGLVIDCQTIECPKHNGRFDIRTGEPARRPAKVALATYHVEVLDGRIVSDIVSPSVVCRDLG